MWYIMWLCLILEDLCSFRVDDLVAFTFFFFFFAGPILSLLCACFFFSYHGDDQPRPSVSYAEPTGTAETYVTLFVAHYKPFPALRHDPHKHLKYFK